MRFPIDAALSPRVAGILARAGHDALHARDLGLQSADDRVIFDRAASEDRILVSADTDFGAILALRQAVRPSVILLRGPSQRRPEAQADLLMQNLPAITEALERGSIIVFEEARIRIRALPIGLESGSDATP